MRLKPAKLARFIPVLLVLAGLSVALISLMPASAVALSTFQSPPPTLPPTVTRPAATNSPVPQVTVAPTPGAPGQAPLPPAIPGRATATAAPQEPVPQEPQIQPTAPGYLPPPTLSAPGGALPPLLPGPGQPLVAPPVPTATRSPVPANETQPDNTLALAHLIDSGVMAVSYLWLCCGVLVLAGAALILVWLVRRGKRA